VAFKQADYSAMKILLQFDPGLRSYTEPGRERPKLEMIEQFTFWLKQNFYVRQPVIGGLSGLVAKLPWETLVSAAMRFSCTLFRLHYQAGLIGRDVNHLLKQEALEGTSAYGQGWRFDTLCDLFSLRFTTEFADPDRKIGLQLYGKPPCCIQRRCRKVEDAYGITYDGIIVEPWWEELKHLVKCRKCHCLMRRWMEKDHQDSIFCHNHWSERKQNGYGNSERRSNNQNSSAVATPGNCLLDRNSSQFATTLRIEHYYVKYGGFCHHYELREHWCFYCLASREGWKLDAEWVPPGPLSEDELLYSDPHGGCGTDDDAYYTCSDEVSVKNDNPVSKTEVGSLKRGKKRKIAEIS
jgi:hypothetical protein